MSGIKNITVIGASGNVGVPLVKALQTAGFQVTALVRESSSSTFPAGVSVKRVNYESVGSLKTALQGQDAVVSTASAALLSRQPLIIDAAIAAGVKRFIPSEYGINTRTVEHAGLKAMLEAKIKTVDYLIEKSKETPSFSWTGLSTGLFFDWGLLHTFIGFNKSAKSARIVDSGSEPFSTSNLPFIGKAVAAILANPEKTANKYITIASFTTTQNEILKFIEEESGEKWSRQSVTSAELNKAGHEKLSQGDYMALADFLLASNFEDGGNHAVNPEDTGNDLLGIGVEDPKVTVKAWLDGKL
ncbi:related to 2`-hydroxyisoflavone reductase [Fusarium torulosum]|uniref:Related to 2`-hydroxyisoflavone reductase n=1 Tax=Fusarium torulosum TaxID=33205 RepID=A0AAE8MLP4_9HYPO|nr:related to 2`-hydroxyisoflavone reductase [Fusarium torulosum]